MSFIVFDRYAMLRSLVFSVHSPCSSGIDPLPEHIMSVGKTTHKAVKVMYFNEISRKHQWAKEEKTQLLCASVGGFPSDLPKIKTKGL